MALTPVAALMFRFNNPDALVVLLLTGAAYAVTRAVEDVLHEIGADRAPQVLVLAKADRVDEQRRGALERRHPGAVLVSAITGEGIDALSKRIEDEFARTLQEVELLIPYEEGGQLAELHEAAGDLEREETPQGVRVLARLPGTLAARYERFARKRIPV